MRLILVANAHPRAADRRRPRRPEHHAGTEVLRLVEARRDLGRRRAGLNDRNPDALDRVRAQEQRLVLRLLPKPPGPALRNHEGHAVAGGLDPGAPGVRLVRLQLLGGCGHHRQRERQDEDEPADHAACIGDETHYALRTGNVNVNVEPTPISLLTQIRPPCSSTNFRHRVSPSPVPSTFLSAVPTCRNSSNTASWSSGAMPTPESLTETSTNPSFGVAATSIRPPSGVNLIALDNKFSTTCRTFRSSAWIWPSRVSMFV